MVMCSFSSLINIIIAIRPVRLPSHNENNNFSTNSDNTTIIDV